MPMRDASGSMMGPTPEELHKIYRQFRQLLIVVLVSYLVLFVLSTVLIGYLRFNRSFARRGDAAAARKVILPAFEPLLWILAIVAAAMSILLAILVIAQENRTHIPTYLSEVFYCGRQFVFLIVLIFLLQKSVTVPALIRSLGITLVLSCYTIPLDLLLSALDPGTTTFLDARYGIMTAAKCLILILFAYVMVSPPCRASKRVLREYCLIAYVYYALVLAYTHLMWTGSFNNGMIILYLTVVWTCFCPFAIWRVLVADTEHWRGLGQRAVALQHLFRQKHHIDDRISSQGLHVLIEMHRKFIIDFAYLEIKHKIGTGSSAVVFNGILHSRTPVAIKVYTPTIFSEETVAEFSQEAALSGALHHPNIVTFHGMCVCPPTICLVSELCQGSLDVITGAIANQHQHPLRQQHLINIAYMLDAARAVAYLHSFSPPFVHRDIKPENFLVDANNTVKLTDFGESRSLPKAVALSSFIASSGASTTSSNNRSVVMDSGASLQQNGAFLAMTNSPSAIDDNSELDASTRANVSSRLNVWANSTSAKMTVKGTVDYMAPEMIKGRAGMAQYGEAADVYSLAVTMWDVLYPGREKYPTVTSNNHLQIFELVIDGKRPGFDDFVHPALRSVIESAWQGDPRLRPSAQNIVDILESIQEEFFSVFAVDLGDEVEQVACQSKQGEVVNRTFMAQHAIDRMEECGFVVNSSEAIRLGNALMDSGMMHHLKHELPFVNSDARYFFDEDNINICQPMLAHDGEDDDDDHSETIDTLLPLPTQSSSHTWFQRSQNRSRSSSRRKHSTTSAGETTHSRSHSSGHGGLESRFCSCRKLGQRLEQAYENGCHPQRRFKKRRMHTIAEENLLTTRLLTVDEPNPVVRVEIASDFDEFSSVAPPVHTSDGVA